MPISFKSTSPIVGQIDNYLFKVLDPQLKNVSSGKPLFELYQIYRHILFITTLRAVISCYNHSFERIKVCQNHVWLNIFSDLKKHISLVHPADTTSEPLVL